MEFNSQYVRDPEDYPDALKFTLEQLTINEVPKVVGSSSYINNKYPSDVDLFERVLVKLNKEDAALFYSIQLTNIAKNVIINEDLFFADFKAGFDPVYNIDIYNIDINNYTFKLYNEEYISEYIYNDLINYIKLNDMDNYYETIRQFKILRWSPLEIIEGKKKLPNNREISFINAIKQDTLVKIDIIFWNINRFIGVEAFYMLSYMENNKVIEFHPFDVYKGVLIKDIKKYSSTKYYNPLKAAKRLWALSRITNCLELIKIINPLLNTDAAALNQVSADIETILLLFNKNTDIKRKQDISKVFLQINGFSKRIANHSSNILDINIYIDNIFDQWIIWKKTNILNIESISNNLDLIDNILKNDIKEKSKEFLNYINSSNVVCKNFDKKIIL